MNRHTHSNLLDHLPLAGPVMAPDLSIGLAPETPPPFGKELIMDLNGCNALISNPEALATYLREAVDLLGMTAYGPPWIHHFGHASPDTSGFTAFQPIETSSLTGHLVDSKGTAHWNLFSCQDFDDAAAVHHAEQFFGADPARTVVSVFYR